MSKLNIIPEAVPVILGGSGTKATENGAGTKPKIKWNGLDGTEPLQHWSNTRLIEDLNIPNGLNHSEITLLRNMLSEFVDAHEAAQEDTKRYIQELWLKCNPEDTSLESEANFTYLNHTKDAARKLKKQKKTIQNILFKLKKQQKNCN